MTYTKIKTVSRVSLKHFYLVTENDIPLSTTQFGQALFPDLAQGYLDLQAFGNILAFGRIQLSKATRQKLCENLPEVVVNFRPRLVQSFLFVFI